MAPDRGSMNQYGKPFLTADWRYLALLNYESDPALLQPLVPGGTELDRWNGKTFVSMVGFSFLNTRVLGLAIPLHENFEEINLRFYVRHKAEDGWRRGVVFIKEIVPRAAIAWVARWLYNENYIALPTGHALVRSPDDPMNIAVGKIFLDVCKARAVSRSCDRRRAEPFCRRFSGRVHRAALLGLFKAEKRRHHGVSCGSSGVAPVAGAQRALGGRCREALRRAVRRGFARHAVVGVSRRRVGDSRLSRSEAGLRF